MRTRALRPQQTLLWYQQVCSQCVTFGVLRCVLRAAREVDSASDTPASVSQRRFRFDQKSLYVCWAHCRRRQLPACTVQPPLLVRSLSTKSRSTRTALPPPIAPVRSCRVRQSDIAMADVSTLRLATQPICFCHSAACGLPCSAAYPPVISLHCDRRTRRR